MTCDFGHTGISYLTSRVNDLSGKFLPFVLDNLAEGILDRGIVTFHKVAVDELYSK